MTWRRGKDIPSHDHSHKPKSTANLEQFGRIGRTSGCWVISELILGTGDTSKEDDKREEDDDEGDVGPQATEQEDERHHRHNHVVVALAGRIGRVDGGFSCASCGCVVCCCQWVPGV